MSRQDVPTAFFYLFAATSIVPGLFVLASRDIVRAAFWLLLSLSGFAGLYVLLGADFLAVAQVVVYLGGILILILFGVMLTNRDPALAKRARRLNLVVPGLAASLLLLAALIAALAPAKLAPAPPDPVAFAGTTNEIGVRLMSDSVLAFELASVLLLAALVGAAYIARRGRLREGGPSLPPSQERAGEPRATSGAGREA